MVYCLILNLFHIRKIISTGDSVLAVLAKITVVLKFQQIAKYLKEEEKK
jgi:hypothetical protein